MPFDRATFYAALRTGSLFDHGLSQRQVTGTEAILNAWDKSGYTDERWLAYALATTYHETGRAMYPVPEGGRGRGHPYGVPGPDGQAAYGRGDVQLTWAENYAKADKELGLGGKLVANYDLALDPDIAAAILLRGMAEAWFTRFRLSDYLNDHLADYLHARRIVNVMDHAETIAGYALVFFGAIQAGERRAADHSGLAAVKPLPPPLAPHPSPAGEGVSSPAALDPLAQAVGDLASIVTGATDTLGSILPLPPAGPSPGAAAPETAATGNSIMEMLPILIDMFGGVAGKLGVASSVVQALPHVVEGTISNVTEIPKAIADINKLIADVKAGNWKEAPNDIHALLGEFGVIINNYGISLPALTAMVPKIAEAQAVPGVVAATKVA